MSAAVTFIHDGEWARVGCLMVYPRDEERHSVPTTFSIGRSAGARSYRDLDGQIGFQNMEAAIDQAIWLNETPDILGKVW